MATKRRAPTEFTRRRGSILKAARGEKSQDDLVEKLGVTRNTISLYESGKIHDMPIELARRYIEHLGVSAKDLLRNPADVEINTELPDLKPEARRVAYAWDQLPASLRQFMLSQIEVWERLVKSSPVLKMLMETPQDPKRLALHERTMETFAKEFLEKPTSGDRK